MVIQEITLKTAIQQIIIEKWQFKRVLFKNGYSKNDYFRGTIQKWQFKKWPLKNDQWLFKKLLRKRLFNK
jgi:hypothetical protein